MTHVTPLESTASPNPGVFRDPSMRLLPVSVLLLLSGLTQAQQLSEIPQGLRDATPRWHALTDVRLVLAPGQVVERGTLVMKDGVIVAAGADVKPPAGARIWSLPGRTVYAGFIDAASSLGQPRGPARVEPARGKPLTATQRWVKADLHQAASLDLKAEDVKAAREQGFTTALSMPPGPGVFRGQSALISLRDDGDARSLVITPDVAQHVAFDYQGYDWEAGTSASSRCAGPRRPPARAACAGAAPSRQRLPPAPRDSP
ncbi:hypothetical protein OSTOST_05730 [Ostertagia ostertagi]